MLRCFSILTLTGTILFTIYSSEAQETLSYDKYHEPEAVQHLFSSWASQYPHLTKLSVMGQTGGKKDLLVLRIAAKPDNSVMPHSRPAVFVSANIEGVHLIGTEAALMLTEKLLTGYESNESIKGLLEHRTVYIAPLLNPDGAMRYFTSPRFDYPKNDSPLDEDSDGLLDEDGPEDLDEDGVIAQMRIKDPLGLWIQDTKEALSMKKIDTEEDESERYTIFIEGLDNDKDGNYNEDPRGGIELNRNFPHVLEHNLNKTAFWPDTAPETVAIIKFLTDHPNINLILHFSGENTLLNLNPTGKFLGALDSFQIPENFAAILGVSARETFSMKQVQSLIEERNIAPPGMTMNEFEIARFLGLDVSLPIEEEDMVFFRAVQNDYRQRLTASGFEYPDQKDQGFDKGAFITFCYFRYGVPVFSSDPGAVLTDGSNTTSQDRGLIDWKPYNHPQLGNVEIGGFAPFHRFNPHPSMIQPSLVFHTDYCIHLMNQMADLQFRNINITDMGDAISRVRITFSNPGWFPTCTAQGQKSRTSWPITVRLKTTKDQMIYAGEPFEIIPSIPGGKTRTLEWQIQGPRGSEVTLSATSFKLGTKSTSFTLK